MYRHPCSGFIGGAIAGGNEASSASWKQGLRGDLTFDRFMTEAKGLPQLDVVDLLMDCIQRGDLVQLVRDVQTGREYPDLLAVPTEIDGKPVLLERLKLLYRFVEPSP